MNLKKFTLVELVIIIALIGILTSFLMPALAKASDKAKLAVCSSNLRQLHIGTSLYASSSNDSIMPSAGITGFNWRYGWNNLWGKNAFLGPFLEQQYSIVQCPGVTYDRGHYYGGLGNSGDYVYWGNSQWSGKQKINGYAFATDNLFEPEDIIWGDIWTMPFYGNLWRNHQSAGLFLYWAGNIKLSSVTALGDPLLYGGVCLPKSVYP